MKILNIIQCANLGGMEKSCLEKLTALKSKGHSISVISLHHDAGIAPLFEQSNINFKSSGYYGPFGILTLPKLFLMIRRENPDVIIVTGHNLVAFLSLIGFKGRKILEIHYHHFENDKLTAPWKILYFFARLIFNKIAFASGYLYSEALLIDTKLAKKSMVIENIFAKPKKNLLNKKNKDALIIGGCGWLIKRKRFDLFIKIAMQVLEKNESAEFLIAGDGPERARLQNIIENNSLSGNIKIIGWQSDISSFYEKIDIFLFISEFDALGRAPIEAALCGVPVVSLLKKGGLREAFASEGNFIIDNLDCVAAANEITRLASDEIYYKTRRSSDIISAENYSDTDRIVNKIEEIIS